MAKPFRSSNRPTQGKLPLESEGSETQSPEIASVIERVKTLLQEQRPEIALDVIGRSRLKSPWITNAVGVCQMRLGNTKQAVTAFQSLVVVSAVMLNRDAPTVFKTNYATAVLASDDVPGCLTVLNEIHEDENPTVRQLRAAIQRWKQSLSFWQKLQWYAGDVPQRPVSLDFPLGELE